MSGFNYTEVITSRQNSSVVAACKLADKKYRDAEKRFRVDGIKLFEEVLQSESEIESVFLREGSVNKILGRIGTSLERVPNAKIKVVADGVFDKMTEEKSPEGIICVVKHIDKLHKIVKINNRELFLDEIEGAKLFAVESVRDPGNMGTVIRTAAAFGIDVLLISSDCADLYNPRTIRAAMGTLFSQHVYFAEDLVSVITALRMRGRVFAAALCEDAARLGEVRFGENDAALVGNEGHGLSAAALQACTDTLYIPMAGGVESLNAGVAASVILWEFYRGQ
jgi:TrmH family RNA methyltransferase